MTNIELVIKIPEEKYDVIKSDLYNTFPAEMKEWGLETIRNGTPLPKGHGNIVDIETLIDMFWDGNLMEITKYDLSVIEPIIKADKESE